MPIGELSGTKHYHDSTVGRSMSVGEDDFSPRWYWQHENIERFNKSQVGQEIYWIGGGSQNSFTEDD